MQTTTKKVIAWAIVVAFLLLIPLLIMQLQIRIPDPGGSPEQLAWSLSDFVFAGLLIFGSGLIYILATKDMSQMTRRVAVGIAVFLALAFVWVFAATGFERFLR